MAKRICIAELSDFDMAGQLKTEEDVPLSL